MEASPMGEDDGECPVRLKKDVKEPALLPKKPVLHKFHYLCNCHQQNRMTLQCPCVPLHLAVDAFTEF